MRLPTGFGTRKYHRVLEPAWAVGSEAALLEPFLSIIESYTTCRMLFSLFQMNLQCVIFRWVHHLVATLHPWRFGATLDVAFFPDASGSVWSDKNWSGVDLRGARGSNLFWETDENRKIGVWIYRRTRSNPTMAWGRIFKEQLRCDKNIFFDTE